MSRKKHKKPPICPLCDGRHYPGENHKKPVQDVVRRFLDLSKAQREQPEPQ